MIRVRQFRTGTCSVILSRILLKSNHTTFSFNLEVICTLVFFKKFKLHPPYGLIHCHTILILFEKITSANYIQIELKVLR